MKIVTRNERAPRRYSVFRSVYLLDDAGMVWADIHFREDGKITIRHLEGVDITTRQANGMGDYDLDHEFKRDRWYSSWCPECRRERSGEKSPQHIFNPLTQKVTCSVCGHTWDPKEDGVDD